MGPARAWGRPVDRVLSMAMFEAVSFAHYRGFFGTVHRALKEDGVALVHSIGRARGPAATDPWVAKYISPGAYCPALSQVLPAVERAGQWATDIEILLALRADADALAPALRRQPRRHRQPVRRAVLPHVRVLPRRLRTGLPARGTHDLADPTRTP